MPLADYALPDCKVCELPQEIQDEIYDVRHIKGRKITVNRIIDWLEAEHSITGLTERDFDIHRNRRCDAKRRQ